MITVAAFHKATDDPEELEEALNLVIEQCVRNASKAFHQLEIFRTG